MQLEDASSVPKCVSVLVKGVPATGLVDTGVDLTMMGGELFKAVAAAAKLLKRDLHKANVTPKTYDQKTVHLDECLVLSIEFDNKTLTTLYT